MRGPAPLVGTLTSLASPTTTRIPHLRAHILFRQSQKQTPRPCHIAAQRHGRRYRSAWASIDVALEDANKKEVERRPTTSQETDQHWQTATSLTGSLRPQPAERAWEAEDEDNWNVQNVESQTHDTQTENRDSTASTASLNMEALLAEGHAERVRFALRDRFVAEDFIRHADDDTFARMFELLDPDLLLEDYKELYRYTKPSLMTQPLYRNIRPFERRMAQFAIEVDRLIYRRRDAGWKVSPRVCKQLLRCAAAMGDASLANYVFDSLMPEDGVEPDLGCYNLLMEALCWSNAFSKEDQFSYRATPALNQIRANRFAKRQRFSESPVEPHKKPSLRVTVLNKFREMVARGMAGNEATFTNMMIAMSREGDLEGAKSILKSVWNIDIDLLNKFDEEEIEGPTFYELGTPLCPSSRLLSTVVHVFGSNNHVGEAFSLLDYISRNSDLEIPERVWRQLCEWTFVLAIRRSRKDKEKGAAEGKVVHDVFNRLWQVMTDQPHNIVPDIPLLYLRGRNLHHAYQLDACIENTRRMKALLNAQRENLVKITTHLLELIERLPLSFSSDQIPVFSGEFLTARRAFLVASQAFDRDLQLVITAFRTTVNHCHHWACNHYDTEQGWERRRLPTLLEEFQEYVPNALKYPVQGGTVELALKRHRLEATPLSMWELERLDEEEQQEQEEGQEEEEEQTRGNNNWKSLQSWRVGLIRNSLDTDDMQVLRRGVEALRGWRDLNAPVASVVNGISNHAS